MSETPQDQEFAPLTSLTRAQRRVLGVLIEKGFTTPEYYPLTLKAATAGCNQKNNRDPVTNYTEDDVADALNQLRDLGLAAVVHTETGRTERYRHWLRRRLTLSEPQLAILGELLLRGRQAIGELRGRASRMAPIETLEQLRDELTGLMSMNLARANTSLERRGVEVDHALYEPREQQSMSWSAPADDENTAEETTIAVVQRPVSQATDLAQRVTTLETTCANLRDEIAGLKTAFDELRRSLGE